MSKKCTKCGEVKSISLFITENKNKSGKGAHCKECGKLASKKWAKENPERRKEIANKYTKKNRHKRKAYAIATRLHKADYDKVYLEENRARICARSAKYKKDNAGMVNHWGRKRHAAKLQRIPKWADMEEIARIYRDCPDGYHVDHWAPLQGKTVSGLHVGNNLQWLLASENSKKSNSFI